MAKPRNIILTEEGVITQEALLAYSQGRLSPEEVAQVDRLLREDPFAQEALDGIRNSVAAAGIDSAVAAINTRLREKAGMREKKRKGVDIHWATYAYAAMIVGVLLGLGFVMVHFMQQNGPSIAMNKATPEAEESVPVNEHKAGSSDMLPDTTHLVEAQPAPVATDTAQVTALNTGTLSVSSALSSPPVGIKQNATAQSTSKLPVTTASGNTFTPASEKMVSPVQTEQVAAKPTVPATADDANNKASARIATAADKDASKTAVPIAAQTKTEAKKEKANATAADNMKEARALFDAGDFKEAAKKYDKVLSDQPDNIDALFFGGICEYKNGKLKPAEKNFDKLIKSGQYVDGSKWYKANVLIDRGKKDEARQLLKELSTTPNPYKDRAVKKYEEVQK